MSQSGADRNLLFGMLALQLDFLTREQLIAAMQAWVFDKSKPLGEILIQRKVLAEDNRALIEALVQKHLAMHGNDVEKSLAAVSSADAVKLELHKIDDPPLQESLAHLSVTKQRPVDIYATVPPKSVSSTSSGSRFRILRPHARGGLGEVFVAKDEELHREVALKEIQDRHADNLESRSRFLLEAEITGGLEHPGIVPVYGLGAYADGRPYYAMRFIRGDSLKDAIDRFHKADAAGMPAGQRALELRSLLGRFIDVCNAIDYAHSRGVLHRDLKPGNVMLGKHGETLVVDWGLAKPLGAQMQSGSTEPGEGSLVPSMSGTGSQTLMGAAVGTPQFMSPEQAAGRLDELGAASDVYSLGATLFCLLSGQASVSDTDVFAVLNKVQRGDIRRLRDVKPGIPLPLEAVCAKAMALKPADRYATPRLLADDLEHWLADEPVSAWREPLTVKARRWVGRHRTLVTGVSAAVIVALIGLVALTVLLTAANERERQAKDIAQKNEKEAIEQKEKAEQNFKLARQAVDRYHTEVSESVLLNEPGMEPLRKKLLLAAREFYEKFVHDRAGDKSVQGDLGRATFRLAQITADVDDPRAAIDLHKQAVQLFDPLAVGKDAALYQSDLAATFHHLGRLYRLTDQLPSSEDAYKKALTLWELRAKETVKDEPIQAGLARTELGLGNYYRVIRRLEEAKKYYEQARVHWAALANAHPQVAAYERELALCENNLGTVYKGLGDQEAQAKKLFESALVIQTKLQKDSPNITQYQNDLARTHFNLGDLTRADAPYQEAIRLWQALVDRNPAITEFHDNLAQAYTALAVVYRQGRDTKSALEACQQAIAIERKLADNQKDSDRYQSDLARGYFTLGEIYRTSEQMEKAKTAYDNGVKIQEKLIRKLPGIPQYQAELARSYNSLGQLYAKTSNEDKANEAFKEALGLWEKLATKYAEDQEFTSGYIGTCLHLGNMAKAENNLKEALAMATRAVETVDASKVKHLANMPVRGPLLAAYKERAEIFTQMGRFGEALQDWDSVFVLARGKEKNPIQLWRTAALARAGKYREAAYEADPLVAKASSGYSQYTFASVYSLAAGAAAADTTLPRAERDRLSEEYTKKALQLLESSGDNGYFKAPANRSKLAADADLQAIRNRPEFKKLADKLNQK